MFLCSKLPPVFSVLPRPAGSLLLVSSIGQRQKGVTLTVGRVTAFRLPLASRSDDEPLFSLTGLKEKGKLGFALAYSSKFGVLALSSPTAAFVDQEAHALHAGLKFFFKAACCTL